MPTACFSIGLSLVIAVHDYLSEFLSRFENLVAAAISDSRSSSQPVEEETNGDAYGIEIEVMYKWVCAKICVPLIVLFVNLPVTGIWPCWSMTRECHRPDHFCYFTKGTYISCPSLTCKRLCFSFVSTIAMSIIMMETNVTYYQYSTQFNII